MKTILIILVLLGALSIIVNRWDKISFKNIEYKRYLDKERVFINEKVKMTTEIVNRKLLPLPWIEVRAEIPNEFILKDQKVTMINEKSKKIYRVITSLISFQRIKRYNTLYCNKRGYYSVYDTKLSIGDIFGFATAEKYISYPMVLIVYPEIKPLEKLVVRNNGLQGEVSVKRWIIPDNTEVIGAREYTSSDSFNAIDWKTTARVGNLYVKKFDFTADPSIVTILNVQTSKVHWQDVKTDIIEKGIDLIAAITQKAINEKISIGYTSNAYFNGENQELFIEPRIGLSQKTIILEALAKTSYTRRISIEELFKSKIKCFSFKSTIVLLTAYISDGLRTELNYYAKHGYRIKLILLDSSVEVNSLVKNIEVLLCSDLVESAR
ncbi:DUF58 domain-containing protein [Brassicibacter mesophilus]|uniref:DUF58 domain-containing protein n=1 Tax=Brassicibacter mesophilus TaxID=745119 RepID=UPI003D209DCF